MLGVVAYGALATLHVVLRQLAGDHFSWLYVLNMLAVVLWAPALPALLLLLLGRFWWPAVALCVLPAVMWATTFGPYLVPGRDSPGQAATAPGTSAPGTSAPGTSAPGTSAPGTSAPGTSLRVIFWNVKPRDPSVDLAALVAESTPDIVMMAELPGDFEDEVVAAVPSLPYHYFAPAVQAEVACCGETAVLSRYPIVDARTIEGLPAQARTAAVVTLDVDGTRMDVVPLHLASPLAGRGVRDLGRQARLREDETAVIADALRDHDVPLLVGGDLNSSMANTPRRLLRDAGLEDLQLESGSGLGTTRRKLRIDWLFASGLRTGRAWTGNARDSDHRPVLADVVLPR
ncbi:hypothetical protein JCM9957A_66340 [Kineosporia succinea]